MSESDTSLGDPQSHKTENFINSSKLIRLNQEVNELKKENSYLLSHNIELNSAFSQLKASIGKNLETTEELRKDMRSKLVKMEHELKDKQDELKEARERITQFSVGLKPRSSAELRLWAAPRHMIHTISTTHTLHK